MTKKVVEKVRMGRNGIDARSAGQEENGECMLKKVRGRCGTVKLSEWFGGEMYSEEIEL